ncbi:MAG: DNA replication terminus site-binding family protein [Proteobacteria bacterium]|nr:DNA replication terminus site-binding family protein [Pseudomonadota bacterium]
MPSAHLRIEALEAFSAMTFAISKLCDAILNEASLIAWVQDTNLSKHLQAREKICELLKKLQYEPNQAPKEIVICPGFVGASLHTINLASEVNNCKERFKKSILELKAVKDTTLLNDVTDKMQGIISRNLHTATTLREAGLARIHLKQCYRKVPILEKAPYKISWTWAHTRSIKTITIQKAQEMLIKKGEDIGIQIQLAKLAHLLPNEKLAIVQELAPHLRANIVYSKAHGSRCMINGPTPIFFPCQSDTPYPKFNPPHAKCGRDSTRSKRSDEKLDPIPFLPAIRAHRYILASV